MERQPFFSCCICGGEKYERLMTALVAPEGEAAFFSPEQYHKHIWRCSYCYHIAIMSPALESTGESIYAKCTYPEGPFVAYQRIVNLPLAESDNAVRCQFIRQWRSHHRARYSLMWALDIGSGLGVFPKALEREGWCVRCVEPDLLLAEHLRSLGLTVEQASREKPLAVGYDYHLISLVKVLEHVENPVAMLTEMREWATSASLYIEVPDGEMAAKESLSREEFFLPHKHAFSFTSLSILIQKARYVVEKIERYRMPSGKYDVRAIVRAG